MISRDEALNRAMTLLKSVESAQIYATNAELDKARGMLAQAKAEAANGWIEIAKMLDKRGGSQLC